MAPSWLYRTLRPIAVPVFEAAFRLDVAGRENVPKDGPVILASVHRSYLDTPFLGMLTWRQVRFMAKAELWDRAFSAWFCDTMGSFPVKRGGADRAALERSLELLQQGEVLALFPEGTRQAGPVVQPLHAGVAYLALKTRAPVVPVAITGSDRAMGPGMSYPKPVKVRVLAGRPLDMAALTAGTPGKHARERGTELLRVELQRLYDGLRQARGFEGREQRSAAAGRPPA